MRAKRVYEGMSSGMVYGNRALQVGGVNRFGRTRGPLSAIPPQIVRRILSLNHTLEEKPSKINNFVFIRVGDSVIGKKFKNYDDDTEYKGVVKSIKKTIDNIIERICINHNGKDIDLDPSTVVNVVNMNNSLASGVYMYDDSMNFEDE